MNSNNFFEILCKKVSDIFIGITIDSIVIPTALLVLLLFEIKTNKIKNKLVKIKRYIQNVAIKNNFDVIFNEGREGELEQQYIKAALLDVKSDDTEKKKTAIEQLAQYYSDAVFYNLIKMLAREKQDSYRYMIIYALKKIADERRKRNNGN